jgi:hypothetical protein
MLLAHEAESSADRSALSPRGVGVEPLEERDVALGVVTVLAHPAPTLVAVEERLLRHERYELQVDLRGPLQIELVICAADRVSSVGKPPTYSSSPMLVGTVLVAFS